MNLGEGGGGRKMLIVYTTSSRHQSVQTFFANLQCKAYAEFHGQPTDGLIDIDNLWLCADIVAESYVCTAPVVCSLRVRQMVTDMMTHIGVLM